MGGQQDARDGGLDVVVRDDVSPAGHALYPET